MTIVKNIVEGTININYKAIVEVYFKVIARRSIIFIKNQIASQLDTPLISKKRYIISFIRVKDMLKIIKLL